MVLPKNLGMTLVSVWFILAGLASFISYGSLGILLPVMMIVTGAVLLFETLAGGARAGVRFQSSGETTRILPGSTSVRQGTAKMKSVLVEHWSQLRAPILVWWNHLNDHDLDQINGDYDALVRLLQKRYSWNRQVAEEQVDPRIAEFQEHQREMARNRNWNK